MDSLLLSFEYRDDIFDELMHFNDQFLLAQLYHTLGKSLFKSGEDPKKPLDAF